MTRKILDWRSMPDGDANRHAYLASRDWAIRKHAVRQRSGGSCERRCGSPATQVHHQTYANLYHEPLEDLLHVCRPCHEFLSGETNIDPCLAGLSLADRMWSLRDETSLLANMPDESGENG